MGLWPVKFHNRRVVQSIGFLLGLFRASNKNKNSILGSSDHVFVNAKAIIAASFSFHNNFF